MNQDSEMIVVYTTFATEVDARKAGGELVAAKLAACVNIIPGITSIYRWKGAIETGNEVIMLVKTRADLEQQVLAALNALHPYDVPALLTFEPRTVAASYLEWLRAELK